MFPGVCACAGVVCVCVCVCVMSVCARAGERACEVPVTVDCVPVVSNQPLKHLAFSEGVLPRQN